MIHYAVADMLHQSEFHLTDSNELIEAATVAVGLGMLRNQFSFVKRSAQFWDPSSWDSIPRPFLNPNGLAYVNALAAWFREEDSNGWINQTHVEISKPTKRNLKYLHKTGDAFLHPDSVTTSIENRTISEWLQLVSQKHVSPQIVALNFFAGTNSFPDDHQNILVDKLRSNDDAIVIHAINAAHASQTPDSLIVQELRLLTESRNEITQSKAIMALTGIKQLDEHCFDAAIKMLQSDTQHVVYTGLLALLTKESISESELKIVKHSFLKYLQSCNYEFVNLFVMAYSRWQPDLKAYLTEMLQGDYPEYLDIALENADSVLASKEADTASG